MNNQIKNSILEKGFYFIEKYKPEENTESIASELGSILDITSIVKAPRIKNIQTLVPTKASDSSKNLYSGNFGFGEFPLHSDLAHWYTPPHYLILRCLKGSTNVSTNLIPSEKFFSAIDNKIIIKSIFRTRTKGSPDTPRLLKVKRKINEDTIWRWDSIFLLEVNQKAKALKKVIKEQSTSDRDIRKVFLKNKGDTLIIDNWKMLHGRSPIPSGESHRVIERTYLPSMR